MYDIMIIPVINIRFRIDEQRTTRLTKTLVDLLN